MFKIFDLHRNDLYFEPRGFFKIRADRNQVVRGLLPCGNSTILGMSENVSIPFSNKLYLPVFAPGCIRASFS